jgi:hypothetical protein
LRLQNYIYFPFLTRNSLLFFKLFLNQFVINTFNQDTQYVNDIYLLIYALKLF